MWKNCLEQLGTHVGDINMHLQQKALIEECSVNKVVLQNLLYTALLYSCDKNPWKMHVKGFYFTWFAEQQPATL